MRALDPRLLARTRSARPLLAVDVALGAVATVLVVAQATLLARVVAGAFAPGSSGGGDQGALIALGCVFAARGAVVWGMEVAGRRAAAGVLSELRMDLAARRLRAHPVATDGARTG